MSTRRGILAALEASHDFISGEDLAEKLGISRAAVWKHIAALKHGGYEIDGVRSRGYRLVSLPSALSEAAIHSRCDSLRIGKTILVLEVTRSTNSDAMALGREGAAEGNVIIAEEQTAGRGRLGRTWESSRGVNLYMSILLRPQVAPWRAPQLSLVAGVAVAETVCEEGIDARIKWPNDVVTVTGGMAAMTAFNTATAAFRAARVNLTTTPAAFGTPVAVLPPPPLRKLAGILTEIEGEADCARFVVVGIGVNLNSDASHFSPELEAKATSVLLERGVRTDRAVFTARLLARFEECYDAWARGGFAAIAPRWRALSVLDGRTVEVASPGERMTGVCAGIDDDGALLVDLDGGTRRRILAGDVTIRGGYPGGSN